MSTHNEGTARANSSCSSSYPNKRALETLSLFLVYFFKYTHLEALTQKESKHFWQFIWAMNQIDPILQLKGKPYEDE